MSPQETQYYERLVDQIATGSLIGDALQSMRNTSTSDYPTINAWATQCFIDGLQSDPRFSQKLKNVKVPGLQAVTH